MFIYRYLSLALLLICLVACHSRPDATDSRNNPIYLSDYKDKWMVINYWATWCKPCLKELPELNNLQRRTNKLVVFGVSFDGLPNTDIQRFANQLHLTFPLLSHFPKEKFGVTEINALPTTLIINPQGKLSTVLYGPQTQKDLLNATSEVISK